MNTIYDLHMNAMWSCKLLIYALHVFKRDLRTRDITTASPLPDHWSENRCGREVHGGLRLYDIMVNEEASESAEDCKDDREAFKCRT